MRCLLVWVVLCAGSAGAAGPLVVPVDGEPFAAKLASVDSAWKLTFSTDDATRDVAADELARFGDFTEPAGGIHVVLAGGGLLVADDARLEADELVGFSATFGKWSLPVELVAAVFFRPPHDRPCARPAAGSRLGAGRAGRSAATGQRRRTVGHDYGHGRQGGRIAGRRRAAGDQDRRAGRRVVRSVAGGAAKGRGIARRGRISRRQPAGGEPHDERRGSNPIDAPRRYRIGRPDRFDRGATDPGRTARDTCRISSRPAIGTFRT